MAYAPQPGTAAYRIVSWLEAQGRTKEFNSSQIAYALHLDTKGLPTQLAPALQAGLVFRRQKDSSSPRAPFWYSLTDHGAVHRREFRPSPKDWMQPINRKDAEESGSSPGTPGASGTPEVSCASSAEAAAADAPSGDQGAAAGADRAAAPTPDTSAPGSQQVLKAEAARPDATDRETPDTASPGVGPMGAGQPADAGPTTDQRSDSGGSRAAPVTAPPGPVCRGDRQDEPEATDAMESGLEDAAQDAGVAPGSLHQSAAQQGTNPVRRVGPAASTPAALPLAEQPREVDEHFARTLREAMAQGDQLHPADLAATRRAVHAPPEAAQPLAFRAARFSDGSLATERDGVVVEVYSAAETDAIQKLLGVRT